MSLVPPILMVYQSNSTDKSKSQSHSISLKTEHDPAYQRLLESFQELAQCSDQVRLEFELVQAARSHKLPISSYRKMFGSWLTSQEEKEVQL